jgi:putative membrane protein
MMHSWWDYGTSYPWFGMIFGPFVMIVFLIAAVLIIAWLIRAVTSGRRSVAPGNSALEILRERFARGEIDRAEYEERRQLLSGS